MKKGVPPLVQAVLLTNLVYTKNTWFKAVRLHALARDEQGVRRAIAAIDAAGELGDGHRILRNVVRSFFKAAKLGETEDEQSVLGTELFYSFGLDFNALDVDGWPCLQMACDLEDLAIVDRLLQAGAAPNYEDDMGETAFFGAVYCGDIRLVNRLLNAGARVGQKNNNRETALSIATDIGYIDIVYRLLEAGAVY